MTVLILVGFIATTSSYAWSHVSSVTVLWLAAVIVLLAIFASAIKQL